MAYCNVFGYRVNRPILYAKTTKQELVRPQQRKRKSAAVHHIEDGPQGPLSFGYKSKWIAIKSNDAKQVLAKLNIQDIVECTWHVGIITSRSESLFVTPVIDGWVLITGAGLPDIGTNKSASKKWLIGLSIEFSEVQYFSTHRVVEYHAWVKAQNGSIKRFHEYLGVANETLTSEGELSEFEMGLNLLNTNIHDPEDDTPESPGEETVMEIAGDWSVNPCTLDDREDLSATGWMGYINRP